MTDQNKIDVQFGGSTTGLDAAAQKAELDVRAVAAAMNAAVDSMIAHLARVSEAFGKMAGDAEKAHQKGAEAANRHEQASKNAFAAIVDAAQKMRNGISDAMSKLTAPFSAVTGRLGAIAVALGGGAAFKKGIDAVKEQNAEAMKLSVALGVTAEEANVLRTALDNVFLDPSTYLNSVRSVTRALNMNADGFDEMGIHTRDAQKNLLPMREIIKNTVAALDEYKAGADRNSMAQQLLGRNYEDVMMLFKLNDEVMKGAKKENEDYHKQLDPRAVEAYKKAMNDLDTAIGGVMLAIGRGAMPVFTEMADWLSGAGPSAVEVTEQAIGILVNGYEVVKTAAVATWSVISDFFGMLSEAMARVWQFETRSASEFFVNCFKVVNAAVVWLGAGIQMSFEGIRGLLEILMARLRRYRDAAWAALHLDWSGVKSAWKKGTADVEKVIADSAARIEKIKEDAKDKLAGLLLPGGSPKPEKKNDDGGKKPGNLNARELGQGKDEKAKDEKSKMPEYEARLSAEKLLHATKNNLRQMDKAEEKAYWQDILNTRQVSAKDRVAIEKKVKELALRMRMDEAKRERDLSKQEIDEAEKAAMDGVRAKENAAQNELATFGMSQARMLEKQREFEQERYLIQAAAQAQRIALMEQDPNQDPVALRAQYDKMLDITRQHELKKQQLAFEGARQDMQVWSDLGGRMSSLWDKGINAMMNGTLRWRNAFRAIGTEIAGWFASAVVKPMVTEWILGENLKSAATQIQSAIRKVLGITTASETGVATAAAKKVEAASVIPVEAAIAAGGAAAAVASIPYVGPAMAAMAYEETMMMVMSGLAVASAAGGFDIPAGLNPVTQLHQREMVLPAQYADVIRGLAASGGGGGGGGGTVNYHDHGGRLSRARIRENARTIAEELNRVHRDGWRPA